MDLAALGVGWGFVSRRGLQGQTLFDGLVDETGLQGQTMVQRGLQDQMPGR